MKIIKKFLVIMCLVLVLPLALTACGEQTFDTTPWIISTKTSDDVAEEVESSRARMMDELNIPVKYVTTTTFKFYGTLDERFSSKIVREVTTATFSSADIQNATAKIETLTYENDVLKTRKEDSYLRYNENYGYKYIKHTTIATSEDDAEEVFMERQNVSMSSRSFYTMLGEIIFEPGENEADIVSQKDFNGIHYYLLTSSTDNLNFGIKEKFSERSDLFTSPTLFALDNKLDDYVMPFSYTYGITAAKYISYFAINYTISNSNRTGNHNEDNFFEKYLTVSSITTLERFGENVEIPSAPENKDDYTVATFDNIVKSDEYYIQYRQITGANSYILTTTQRRADGNVMVSIDTYIASNLSTEYYFLEYSEDKTFVAYKINSENDTYAVDENFSAPFIAYNFSSELVSATNGVYQFGTSESYYLLTLNNGEIYSITNSREEDAVVLLIENFGNGQANSGLRDLSGLTEESGD